MSVLAKFKAFLSGSLPPDAQKVYEDLRAADIPVSDAACRSCPDPCDQDHDDYSRRISVDMESDMLGSVKPYRRQVLISTGQSDWAKEVTEAEGTLATFLSSVNDEHRLKNGGAPGKGPKIGGGRPPLPGLFTSNGSGRLSIQNGSHRSFSEDPSHETVIVFPDFKVIADVPRSPAGAEMLWTAALDPSYGKLGAESRSDSVRSWALPYSSVILLCSHKRRDKRCSIAAPILEKTFTRYLEHEGWAVHTELEDLSGNPTMESSLMKSADPESAFTEQLRAIGEERKALILRISHMGGHKFAGNVIIYNPQGTSVWYGRITPHDVESIVKNTIMNGQVLPAVLRGGMNLARPGCKGLNDW
ncbi:Sucrase/ferredoxin-like-domain-containing protein [Chiua virens]|nr:Sucrase/ferredoxin-like-domain-containing protein [Chiua virens]